MGLRINDIAPDFTAQTAHGEIAFHDWLGDGWGIALGDASPESAVAMGFARPSWMMVDSCVEISRRREVRSHRGGIQ